MDGKMKVAVMNGIIMRQGQLEIMWLSRHLYWDMNLGALW